MFRFLSDKIKTHFVHSLIIALSAALLCIETLVLSSFDKVPAFKLLLPFLVLLSCTTFFVYNFHHLFLMSTTIFKGVFAANFWRFIFIVATVAAGFVIKQLLNSEFKIWFVINSVIAIIITTVYIKPPLRINIRKWFLFKNLSLIIVFSIATVLLPILYSSHPIFNESTLLIFARRCLFIAALLIPFEIRDVQKDSAIKNSNIAISLGVTYSKLISIISLIIFTALAFYQFHLQLFFFLMMISASISGLLVLLYSAKNKFAKYLLLLIDSMMLLQALMLIFMS